MSEIPPAHATRPVDELAPLDGLRFIAFSLVLVHHSSPIQGLDYVHRYGWIGVEFFLVISSFLFFTLFKAEYETTGRLDSSSFYFRRAVRIYPLLIFAPLASLAVHLQSVDWSAALLHYCALLTLTDNVAAAVRGYSAAIPSMAHLWTLSYEAQIYAVLPLAFGVCMRLGRRKFVLLLVIMWLLALLARAGALALHVGHPAIWVLPVLRPESTLAGIVLAICWQKITPMVALAAAGIGMALWSISANVPDQTWSLMFTYPATALIAFTVVVAALRVGSLSAFLNLRGFRYLGAISYGLYVWHVLALELAAVVLPTGIARLAFAFVFSIVMAAASYHLLEAPLRSRHRARRLLQRS